MALYRFWAIILYTFGGLGRLLLQGLYGVYTTDPGLQVRKLPALGTGVWVAQGDGADIFLKGGPRFGF